MGESISYCVQIQTDNGPYLQYIMALLTLKLNEPKQQIFNGLWKTTSTHMRTAF